MYGCIGTDRVAHPVCVRFQESTRAGAESAEAKASAFDFSQMQRSNLTGRGSERVGEEARGG